MELEGGMPPGGLFNLGIWVRVPKEGNQHEGLKNPYESPSMHW